MTTFELRLIGGPHHDQEGWFSHDKEGHPDHLYVTTEVGKPAMIFGDTEHPFATPPFDVYRRGSISSDGKTRIYHYVQEGQHGAASTQA